MDVQSTTLCTTHRVSACQVRVRVWVQRPWSRTYAFYKATPSNNIWPYYNQVANSKSISIAATIVKIQSI